MLGFLLRPRWLLTHLVVLALVVAFVNVGLWQLRRLDERRALNATVSERMAAPPTPLTSLVSSEPVDELAYRRVTVTGTYAVEDEVLLTPRSDNQQPGHHVLTPLVLDDGSAVVVDRGWVPFDSNEPPVQEALPPAGEVSVEGIVLPPQEATRSGTFDGSDDLVFVSAVDVGILQDAIAARLLPVGVLLREQRPAPAGLPRPGDPPEVSEGSHLSYALQWFSFAAIALFGYPLLLRRSIAARRQPAGEAGSQ